VSALRTRLQNRRASETFAFECSGRRFIATISRFPNNELADIFLNNGRAGSDVDAAAKDSAILCSLALQHHVPLETIRKALLRDSRGTASSPLGVALDIIAEEP